MANSVVRSYRKDRTWQAWVGGKSDLLRLLHEMQRLLGSEKVVSDLQAKLEALSEYDDFGRDKIMERQQAAMGVARWVQGTEEVRGDAAEVINSTLRDGHRAELRITVDVSESSFHAPTVTLSFGSDGFAAIGVVRLEVRTDDTARGVGILDGIAREVQRRVPWWQFLRGYAFAMFAGILFAYPLVFITSRDWSIPYEEITAEMWASFIVTGGWTSALAILGISALVRGKILPVFTVEDEHGRSYVFRLGTYLIGLLVPITIAIVQTVATAG